MPHVIGFVGEFTKGEVECSKCGQQLRGDHGYKLSDGSYVCRDGSKCSLKLTSRKATLTDAPMRWRKN